MGRTLAALLVLMLVLAAFGGFVLPRMTTAGSLPAPALRQPAPQPSVDWRR
jgi:hypothetical protein